MNPTGILETIDKLIQAFVQPLSDMGGLLSQLVTLNIGGNNEVLPMSTAALAAFVQPFVNYLGPIMTALSSFLASL